MRSGVMWRLFLFILARGNDPVLGSGMTRGLPTDDKVAIVLKPTTLLFGSCPIGPSLVMNVRLQALKTKSGAIFRRKAVTDDVFACLTALGSQPLAASSIQECSEQTKAAGLEMFRWNGGNCTGYTNGIPGQIARCAGAGSVGLYSMDADAISPVVSNLTLAISGNMLINVAWDVTPNSCFVAYRVSFNTHDTIVSDKLATVGLDTAPPCAEYPLTVTPVDENTAGVGPAATVKVVIPKALELSLNVTYGVTAVKASGRAEYTCNPNKQPTTGGPAESYSVKLGSETETTNNSTFEFIFNKEENRCTDTASTLTADLNEITFKAFDGTGAQLGNVTVILTDTIMPGHRYRRPNKNCIYYQKLDETPGGVGFTFDQTRDFCQKTMFSNPFMGDEGIFGYLTDLRYLNKSSPRIEITDNFIDLKRNSTSGKWEWPTGEELALAPSFWDSGEPSAAGDCAKLKANLNLAAVSCDVTNMATVCYDYFTV